MIRRGIWKPKCFYGKIVDIKLSQWGRILTVRYDDGEQVENYEMEWQQLKQLTRRRPVRGIDLQAKDMYDMNVSDYLEKFHAIDLDRALEVESSTMHKLKHSRIHSQAEEVYATISPRYGGELTPRQRLEKWLR